MSSFKNFAPMLTSLQAQADGTGTLDGSAIEDFLSIAGYEPEGGGGGDFSKARVTVVPDNGEVEVQLYNVAHDDSSFFELPEGTVTPLYSESYYPTEETVYETVLYEGKSYLNTFETVLNVSGNISLLKENTGLYEITGDCSITLNRP